MSDRDLQDIKQKLVDIETAQQENHASLWEAVRIVDNQVGKLTEALTAVLEQLNRQGKTEA